MPRLIVKEIIHERDENGELLPIEVELEAFREYDVDRKTVKTPGPTILVKPLTRGQSIRLRKNLVFNKEKNQFESTEDMDAVIVMENCVDPKFDEQAIELAKSGYIEAIALAIVAVTNGVTQDTAKQQTIRALEDLEKNVKKK